jgi:hypothetical protein
MDQQQFNLTPFPIFIPEKRQFFLENAGVFDFSLGEQDKLSFLAGVRWLMCKLS